MIVDKDLAKKIEHTIMQSHLAFTLRYKKVEPKSCVLEIGGGAACFSGADSFFSQVVGWGFDDSELKFSEQLNIIEQFYQGNGMDTVSIELCPLVGASVFETLNNNQYHLAEASNISFLELTRSQLFEHDNQALVSVAQKDEIKDLSEVLAVAFGAPESREHFYQYCTTKGIIAFQAMRENKLAAGATMAIFQEIADLGLTATLKEHRGHGLQKALLLARLQYAKQNKVKVATVTTEPGSISDLNVQKVGFRCAYTRIKFEKQI